MRVPLELCPIFGGTTATAGVLWGTDNGPFDLHSVVLEPSVSIVDILWLLSTCSNGERAAFNLATLLLRMKIKSKRAMIKMLVIEVEMDIARMAVDGVLMGKGSTSPLLLVYMNPST